MKSGLIYSTGDWGTDPDQLIAGARHAEACGFESFYVTEHIALYPGAIVGPLTRTALMPAQASLNPWPPAVARAS